MQVQVSLTIEIDATASLTQMEEQIQQVGQQAMRQAFKQVIRHWEEQRPSCPHCGDKQRRLEGTTRRVIATMFGRVEVQRRRFRCQRCGRRWCPATSLFSELKGGTVSQPRPRSSHVGGLFLALSAGERPAQTAQRRPDQCRGDPSADQSGGSAPSSAAARGSRAGLLRCGSAGASRPAGRGASVGGVGWRLGV